MIILLGIIAILVTVSCFYKGRKNNFEGYGFEIVGVVIGCFAVILLTFCASNCISEIVAYKYIDEKIIMYSEENEHIENQIDVLVQQYMSYESSTLTEFTNQNSVSLIAMYAELKSDILVQSQLNTYVSNNDKIKKLKEEKINAGISRWWLYFGK